jgi:DNA-binding transcriptional MerR regulator
MGQNAPIRRNGNGSESEIPDKLYFRIGEVAGLCEVPAYVLRFWESEFPQLKPNKGGTGQRLYRRRDVETALRIKRLLYSEGYTIPGARQVFKAELKHKDPQLALPGVDVPSKGLADASLPKVRLRGVRRELQEIVVMLSRPPGKAIDPPVSIHTHRAASARKKATSPLADPTRTGASLVGEIPFGRPVGPNNEN